MLNFSNNKKAFTLLEILLAITALVILVTIVIIAINPKKQINDTRNAKRLLHLKSIKNAIEQYSIDNSAVLPFLPENQLMMIGSSSDCSVFIESISATSSNICINLESYLSPDYLSAIPFDPYFGSPEKTYYFIELNNSGRFEIYSYFLESKSTPSIEVEQFICGSSLVSDIEGNQYQTIQIGSQCWFKENLKTTKLNNNQNIINIEANELWSTTTPAYSCFNNV